MFQVYEKDRNKNQHGPNRNHIMDRVVLRLNSLFAREGGTADEIEIHETKSLLYAAIERVGFAIDRLNTVHRLLRELFAIVGISKDAREYEKKVGLQILKDLNERYHPELVALNKIVPNSE